MFKHSITDFGGVVRFVIPVLIRPWTDAALGRKSVDRSVLQWGNIQENEISSAVGVEAVEGVKDTIGVIDKSRVIDLAILDKGIVSKVLSRNFRFREAR